MNIEEWKSRGKYYQYKQHEVFYLDEGKGETLLLIHGFPTSSWDWNKIWNRLTQKFRVIALDMMGYGFTDKPIDYRYSIFDQADLHEKLLHSLNVDEFNLLAHDYGDTVAQELLARFNNQETNLTINKLCLLNGGLFPGNHKPRLIQKMLMSPIGFIVAKLSNKSKLRNTFKNIFGKHTQATEEEIDVFWYLMTYKGGKKIVHKVIQYMKERVKNESRWVGALQKTKIPMRLINGVVDPISGIHMAEKYRKVVANPDVILLEEIGHYPQVEAPLALVEHLFEFLEK